MPEVFVGNLDHDVREEHIRSLFELECGSVVSVKVMMDEETGNCRGFAFVNLLDQEDADYAKKELNGYELFGREIRVKDAVRS